MESTFHNSVLRATDGIHNSVLQATDGIHNSVLRATDGIHSFQISTTDLLGINGSVLLSTTASKPKLGEYFWVHWSTR